MPFEKRPCAIPRSWNASAGYAATGARIRVVSGIGSGPTMPPPIEDASTGDAAAWERLLSTAARLQRIVPEAVLVGGTAAALHAGHRMSRDDDHVVPDLRERFSEVLAQLESVAGWRTARVARPVLILGSLDGIETGVRQLTRAAPLETEVIERLGVSITVPTAEEMLRIKAVLILRRNATRDYVDFAALADHLARISHHGP